MYDQWLINMRILMLMILGMSVLLVKISSVWLSNVLWMTEEETEDLVKNGWCWMLFLSSACPVSLLVPWQPACHTEVWTFCLELPVYDVVDLKCSTKSSIFRVLPVSWCQSSVVSDCSSSSGLASATSCFKVAIFNSAVWEFRSHWMSVSSSCGKFFHGNLLANVRMLFM